MHMNMYTYPKHTHKLKVNVNRLIPCWCGDFCQSDSDLPGSFNLILLSSLQNFSGEGYEPKTALCLVQSPEFFLVSSSGEGYGPKIALCLVQSP